jgi:type IV pilus assembly protein PilA
MKIKSLITAVSSALALFISTTMIGFSLIELLVVVAIIGILAAIGTVGYNNYVNSARVAATVANAVSISEALQACDAANNCGNYIPTAISSNADPSLVSYIVAGLGNDVNGVPLNPLDGIAGSSNARNPWDNSQLSMINSNIDSFGTGSTGGGGSGCSGLGHIVVNVLYNNTIQIQACTIATHYLDLYGNDAVNYSADPNSPAPFQMINIHG